MSERTSYLAIRDEFLLTAFQYCADKFQNGMVLPWKEGESEWVYAADKLAQKYDMPVEKMMLSVAAVIANAGRIPPSITNISSTSMIIWNKTISIKSLMNSTPNRTKTKKLRKNTFRMT